MAYDRTRQPETAAKLHTAGPNIPDRDIRLDLLGPAAFGSGPSRSKECDADLSGMEQVVGGAEPGRAGINQVVPLWESGVIHTMLPLGYRTAPRRPL
jgi:hypothetical protein